MNSVQRIPWHKCHLPMQWHVDRGITAGIGITEAS